MTVREGMRERERERKSVYVCVMQLSSMGERMSDSEVFYQSMFDRE